MKFSLKRVCVFTGLVCLGFAGRLLACPFCDAPAQTLSEETSSADAVVLARLVKEAPPNSEPSDPTSGTATFEIVDVLRGKEILKGAKEAHAVYFGEADHDRLFMITGLGTEKLDWTTPLPLSKAAEEYIWKLPTVAPSGIERLVFFQDYLENADPLLAQDSYDEFARAPYEEVREMGPRMHHDDLVKWIANYEINPSRRRLYLTMLSACGTKNDLPILEEMIVSDFTTMEPGLNQIVYTGLAMDGPIGLPALVEIVHQQERQKKLGLDALVACYLVMRGPDGLDLIDERFLKDPKVEYTYVYSAIMALRFHGDQNTGVVPKERLLKSMRLLLDNPDFSDQVVLDLSRWEDWSVLDKLVQMFKTADAKSYVRQPVVTYLTVASDVEGDVGKRAQAALAELESLDPATVKQARSLMAFGALARARATEPAAAADGQANPNASATTQTVAKPAADPAKTPATEDSQAFGASDADNSTDVSQIPDPAAYEKAPAKDDSATTATDATAASKEVAKADATAANKPSVAASTAKTSAVVPATAVTAPSHVRPVLIVGMPLLAAAALMGVYWLILRAGAV